MNKIKEVAKLLGCEVGEEFNIIYNTGKYSVRNPFTFSETDLLDKFGGVFADYIGWLITGEYKIEKIPFIPKMGENYWTYTAGITLPIIECYSWGNSCYDRERKLFDIVFRTEQEAKDYLPTWQKRLEGEKV